MKRFIPPQIKPCIKEAMDFGSGRAADSAGISAIFQAGFGAA